jgi:hypothetical protein
MSIAAVSLRFMEFIKKRAVVLSYSKLLFI